MIYGLPNRVVIAAFQSADEIKDRSKAYKLWACYLRMLVASHLKPSAFTCTAEYLNFVRLKNHVLPFYVRHARRKIKALRDK